MIWILRVNVTLIFKEYLFYNLGRGIEKDDSTVE